MRAHISQESRADKIAELLVKYSIGLVSYFLPNPITIHRRSLLPLANPNTSGIITNHSSTISTSINKGGFMTKSDAQKKAGVMAKEWWKSRSNEQTIEDLVVSSARDSWETCARVADGCFHSLKI